MCHFALHCGIPGISWKYVSVAGFRKEGDDLTDTVDNQLHASLIACVRLMIFNLVTNVCLLFNQGVMAILQQRT